MSAAQGRFLSADPSSKGISLLDPQSWNRYSYVQNRTLSFVDPNGKWATPLHGDITSIALQGYVSAAVLNQLIGRQKIMDKDQSTAGAYKHAMHAPGQTAAQAKQKMWGFVASNLGSGSIDALGDAIHSVQDYAAPGHTSDSFEPMQWSGMLSAFMSPIDSLRHFSGENTGSDDWSRFGLAVQLSMAAFMWADPETARQKGLTSETFDSQYRERITSYINSYYLGLLAEIGSADPSNYFAIQHQLDMDADAARICALGNPAACVK